MHCTQIQWIRVESIIQLTTTPRNDHLNSYQLQQPYYNKMCLLTHNKISWPTNRLLKGKNIDLRWFWHCWTVWCCRLPKKTTSKQAKEWVKRNSHSQVRTQNLLQDLPSSRKQNRVVNHCTKRTLKWRNLNNLNICTPSFPCLELLLFIYLTHKHHYRARPGNTREILCISAHADRWYHPLCLHTVTCTSGFGCKICRKWPIDEALSCSFFCFRPGRHKYKK